METRLLTKERHELIAEALEEATVAYLDERLESGFKKEELIEELVQSFGGYDIVNYFRRFVKEKGITDISLEQAVLIVAVYVESKLEKLSKED